MSKETIRNWDGTRSWQELRDLYPAYETFNRLRQSCDPQGLFRNSFVDRVFPDH